MHMNSLKANSDIAVQILNFMSPEEKEMRSVHAVALGAPVTFSTQYFPGGTPMHNNCMLDYFGNGAKSWSGH